jgi:hypothetical protein
MKNELSWIPLASGSEAVEVVSSDSGSATTRKQAMTKATHNFDVGGKGEKCGSFIQR